MLYACCMHVICMLYSHERNLKTLRKTPARNKRGFNLRFKRVITKFQSVLKQSLLTKYRISEFRQNLKEHVYKIVKLINNS